MKKIESIFIYSLGSFLALVFNWSGLSAQITNPLYGTSPGYIETGWRFLQTIFFPLFLVLFSIFALLLGTLVFIRRRKKKNDKKDT